MARKKNYSRSKRGMNHDGIKRNRKRDEQAAALEISNKPPGIFKRISNKGEVWKNRRNRNLLKPVILAFVSALVIGSLFGFIMLRMFVAMDPSPELGSTNPAAVGTDDAGEENTEKISETASQTVELESVTAYVLQAGVFSERANAEIWATQYEEEDIPTMIWNRDNQYFLFAGLANSAEQASQTAKEMESAELELYSKAWETTSYELSLTAGEEEWINAYLAWWKQAIISDAAEESAGQLEQLTETFADNSNQLAPLYEKLEDMNEGNEITDKNLLELWYIYETLDD